MEKMCETLEATLSEIVEGTREDEMFIVRLRQEFLQTDDKWKRQLTDISQQLSNIEYKDNANQEVKTLKGTR